MRSGEVDLLLSASIDEDQRHTLHERASAGELHESVGPAMEIGYITLLSNREPFQDPNLRRALAVSLNQSEISERVSYGLRRPLRALVPPAWPVAPWPMARTQPRAGPKAAPGSGLLQRQHPALSAHLPLQCARRQIAGPHLAGPGATGPPDCLVLDLDGVESTTIYRQLGEGAFKAVMLDWRGSYPDPEAYLTPLLSCTSVEGNICMEGEAVISGSFWSAPGLQTALLKSDTLTGDARRTALDRVDHLSADGAAYIPVWLDSPRPGPS